MAEDPRNRFVWNDDDFRSLIIEEPGVSGRRFPAPWTVEKIEGGFKVLDATGQALAYVYARSSAENADAAKALTPDEARRIAANIAKLPELLNR